MAPPKGGANPIVAERLVVTAGGEYLMSSGIVSGEASASKLLWKSGITSQAVLKQLSVTTATGMQATRSQQAPRASHKPFDDPTSCVSDFVLMHAFCARPDVDTTSTISHSSTNQSSFRTKLHIRDGGCVFSNAHYSASVAAHILPVSRPEYYREVLNLHNNARLYEPSHGLLLATDLHHAFDRGNVAFYPNGNRLVVHVFATLAEGWRTFHGKIILPTRFRMEFEPAPNVELLRFHYRQCCMKHLRGYAAQMNLPQRTRTLAADAEEPRSLL